jgi:hypothetical protein
VVLCDNMSVCIAVNTGKTRCVFLQKCLREICFIAATNEFEIRAEHLLSSDNRIADHLSRWHKHPSHEITFKQLTEGCSLKQWEVGSDCFHFLDAW